MSRLRPPVLAPGASGQVAAVRARGSGDARHPAGPGPHGAPRGPRGYRRRLWFRRAVRRAWYVLAAVAVAELVLAVAQRLLPLEQAPLVALAIPVLGLLVLLVLVVRVRPSIGETALAVDAEGGVGRRLASALAFAVAMPATAGPVDAG